MTSRAVLRTFCIGVTLFTGVRPASADWTFGVFLGGARTEDTSIRLTQASHATDVTVLPVRYRSESLEAPIYYGYRVGFFPLSGWLGLEGEFIHLKVIADTARPSRTEGFVRGSPVSGTRPLAATLERFSITHGVNLILVNTVVRRAVSARAKTQPRWFFTGRFGAGCSAPHAESTIAGVSLEQYEWGAFSVQAAGGAEVRLARRVYLSGEYKFTRTVQNVSVIDGSIRTPLSTHHLVAGIAAYLGGVGR